MRKTIAITLSLLLLLLNLGSFAQPQTAYAQAAVELRGTVTDETGAFIPAAPLTLDDGQGKKITAQTDERGHYRFSGLKPGIYTLTVEVEGFAPFTGQVDLMTRRAAPFDVALKVFISEQQEVKADTSGISTEPDKNLSAITLGEKELEALPDDPDELLQTLKDMAGAAGGSDPSVYVGGFREGGRIPPKEAILRVNISANPFAAEFSEPGFSRIEIITKPGSDTFHGGFRLNFNDESLNARNAFAPDKAALQVRNFGGNFNGPIIRNRWGFFVDMDRRETDENDVVNALVLNPTTFLPEGFAATVLTPERSTNFSIRSDYLLTKRHTLGMQYRYNNIKRENLGLGSGFDLPERAFNQESSENTFRFSFTSIMTERSVNEMRLQFSRRNFGSLALTDGVAINVLDAFNAGGNQSSLFADNTTREIEFTNNLTYTYKKHVFKAGFRAEGDSINNLSRSNFGGTFTFGTDFERDPASGEVIINSAGQPTTISGLERYRRVLLGIPGYRPSQFLIVRGDPAYEISQWEMGLFVQDDWRISNNITFSYGLRSEFQTHLQDKLNLAPRMGLAWVPDKKRKSTIRLGAGIFYNRLDTGINLEIERLDPERQQQFFIDRPNFFQTIPDTLTGAVARPSTLRVKAEDINAPYSIVSTANYERQLPKNIFGSIGYTWSRGVHLLRTRNINAPLGVDDDGDLVLPFPGQGPILQFESTGLSIRHELRLGFRAMINRNVTLFTNYTLSSTRSDTDSAYSSPADPYNLALEWGRSSGDARHQMFFGGRFVMPWGITVAPLIRANTGRPFNITLGSDLNRDTSFAERPSFALPGDAGAVTTDFGIFNPNPRPGDEIIPRNFGEGPGFFVADVNLSKTFGFGPPQGNFPGQANRAQGQQQNQQQGQQGQNQRGNQGQGRGGNQGRGGQGGQPGGGMPGGGGMVMRTGGPGGGAVGGMGGFFGGEGRNKYNLTLGVNIRNLFNHTNLANYNGVLTSSLFGTANRTFPRNERRIEASLRFSF